MNGLAFALVLIAALLLPAALTHPGFNGASALIVLLVVAATAITLSTTRKAIHEQDNRRPELQGRPRD